MNPERKTKLSREYVARYGGFNPGWDCVARNVNHCWHLFDDGNQDDRVCCECFYSNEVSVDA